MFLIGTNRNSQTEMNHFSDHSKITGISSIKPSPTNTSLSLVSIMFLVVFARLVSDDKRKSGMDYTFYIRFPYSLAVYQTWTLFTDCKFYVILVLYTLLYHSGFYLDNITFHAIAN